MRVSLKSVSGVDSVEVSLEKGLAAVEMKPGNTATLRQLNEAISKNGFAMKDSTATILGKIVVTNGKTTLQVSGSNEIFELVPDTGITQNLGPMTGKPVLVSGTIPEASKGKHQNTIRYRSVEEQSK